MMGEVEVELKGHTGEVTSVAFAWDGRQVVSGSHDNTVWIWNTVMGEVEAVLKGHTGHTLGKFKIFLADLDYT